MQKNTKIQYLKLPEDLKKGIQENLKNNKNLKSGFYSSLYSINIDGNEVRYRFRCNEIKKTNSFTIIFSGNENNHKPFQKGNTILIFDKELQRSLKLDYNLINKIWEDEINYNLSSEQKQLLFLGHEITLEVNQKSKLSNFLKLDNRKVYKSYIADYTFFLAKTSLLFKEKNPQQKINKTNILKHDRG